MATNHIIVATYAANGYSKTRCAYQYDYGQELVLEGFPDLPVAFEVHFAVGMGQAITRIGAVEDGRAVVAVPNQCFYRFGTITAWLFLHDSEADGETRYMIEIPVRSRAHATDQDPTPAEQSVIDEAIAALQTAVEMTEAAQDAAEDAQDAAEAAQGAAETAQGAAETAQELAEAAQTAAEAAQTAAETAQGKAEDAQGAAETAQGKAEDAQGAAETAQGKAEDAQAAASGSATAAAADALKAEGYATGTQNGTAVVSGTYYNNNAAYYAGEAADSATAASNSETGAQTALNGFLNSTATATTLAAGSDATVTVSESSGHKVFGFGIPKGDKGDKGDSPTAQEISTATNTWLNANITNPSSPPLDRSLSTSSSAAPADLVGDLKSAITYKLQAVYSENKWNPSNTVSGYMTANGTEGDNSSYAHLADPIPVSPGDVVRSYEINAGGGFATAGMRWLCAMNSSKTAVTDSGSNSNISSYTVPEGIAYINPTMNIGGQKQMITINLEETSFIDYIAPYYVATPDFIGTLNVDENTDFDSKYLEYTMIERLKPSDCQTGKFINGTTGAVSDNASYYVTGYMEIRPGETLYFYQRDNKTAVNARSIAAYDATKTLLDTKGTNSETNHFEQSGAVAFIRCSFAYLSTDIVRTPYGIGCMANSNPEYVTGYGGGPVIKDKFTRKIINVKTTDTEAQVISKFVEAFDTGECDVVFERGSYAFGTGLASVQETYHLYENEIPIGNGCRYFFNGSTLTATLDASEHASDFTCNFFGCQKRPSSYEMHDGVLVAYDTVYVVHDESNALAGSYKHIYENMEMHYHTTSSTAEIRKCIGGGTGASGVVEIIGCKFTTDAVDACVSFHGNGTDVSGATFDWNVRNSYFSNGIRGGELSTNQTARLFYTGNSAASAPLTYDRWTKTEFLNEVRT